VPVYFLKVNKDIQTEKLRKMDIACIDKCWYEIQEQKKFRYGIPAYTGPFRALVSSEVLSTPMDFVGNTDKENMGVHLCIYSSG
jgi:hypothetical protein